MHGSEPYANVYSHSHTWGETSRLDPMSSETSPKQARSRATAERLLAAAIRVVDEVGLEGATVPRIAAAADVAPASVYRRYADKDALLRAAFLHALENSNQNNRQMMTKLLLR